MCSLFKHSCSLLLYCIPIDLLLYCFFSNGSITLGRSNFFLLLFFCCPFLSILLLFSHCSVCCCFVLYCSIVFPIVPSRLFYCSFLLLYCCPIQVILFMLYSYSCIVVCLATEVKEQIQKWIESKSRSKWVGNKIK